MPPGRVAYPVKLAWHWPKLMVTSTAVSAQTRRKALSASTCLKPARGGPAAGCPLAGGWLGGVCAVAGRAAGRRRASIGRKARKEAASARYTAVKLAGRV